MAENPRERFGAHLSALRESRVSDRDEFLQETGFSTSYVHYVEHGRVIPRPVNLKRFEDALSLSPEELVEFRQLWRDARDHEPPEPPYPGGDN